MFFLDSLSQLGRTQLDNFSTILGGTVDSAILCGGSSGIAIPHCPVLASAGVFRLGGALQLPVTGTSGLWLRLATRLTRLVASSLILSPRFGSPYSSLMQPKIMVGKLTIGLSRNPLTRG